MNSLVQERGVLHDLRHLLEDRYRLIEADWQRYFCEVLTNGVLNNFPNVYLLVWVLKNWKFLALWKRTGDLQRFLLLGHLLLGSEVKELVRALRLL